jgi:hypothetical protein
MNTPTTVEYHASTDSLQPYKIERFSTLGEALRSLPHGTKFIKEDGETLLFKRNIFKGYVRIRRMS